MKWLTASREWLRGLLFRGRVEAESEEEMRFHLDMEAARREREQGLSPAEARRQASLAFGGVDRHREAVRDARGLFWLNGLSLDAKLGARMLVKFPGLTFAGVLALAVAAALATGWFEFIREMTRPRLPLEEGDRIVQVRNWDRLAADAESRSLVDFARWRTEVTRIEDLAAASSADFALTTDANRVASLRGARMTAAGLRLARVEPLLGRTLVAADEAEGAPLAVVIGYRVWQELFDGDRAVIGRGLRVGNTPGTVVGVMPEGFGFPINQEIWVPLQERAAGYAPRTGPRVIVLGRLVPGATLETAQAELTTIGRRMAAEYPQTHEHLAPRVRRLNDSVGMSPLFSLANIPFILFLVVVCANVATLVFARTAARSGEIAVRSALGATRRRLVLQLVAEALVLTSLGTALGVAVASWGLKRVMALFWEVQQERPPFWFDPSLSVTTLLYAVALAVLAAAIIGGFPALKATSRRLRHQLVQAGSGGAGLRFGAVSTGVIVVQVALCVAFLPYAILQARALMPEPETATSFPADEYLSGTLILEDPDATASAAGPEDARLRNEVLARLDELRLRIASDAGVAAVTFASRLPGFNHPNESVQLEQDTIKPLDARVVGIDPGFFAAMNVRVVAGRNFRPEDARADLPLVIVDADWAREVFVGRDPVGQRIRFADRRAAGELRWYEIIGTVEDVDRAVGPGSEVVLFQPLRPAPDDRVQVYVRTLGPPESSATQVQSSAGAVDPRLSVIEVQSLAAVWEPVLRSDIYYLAVLNVVAIVILGFALIGIYALMSFTVSQRTREIAIRVALGANPRRILVSIFSRAISQIGLGVALGAVLISLAVAHEPGGPLLVGVVSLLMMLMGLIGCAVPAARALRIQPTAALKAE